MEDLAAIATALLDPAHAPTGVTALSLPRGFSLATAPVPSKIGRFQILRVLGAGGMGVVYLAEDRDLQRSVALKVVRGNAGDEAARTRMRREAQAMAQLDHPNVVRVYEVGEDAAEQLFIAMEFVAGQTLRAWLEAPRSPDAIFEALEQARRGLAAAHAVGLVHRDFKPDNVLVDETGVVKVLDFGLARSETAIEPRTADDQRLIDAALTSAGAVVGTPYYMAPEQLAGEPATAASDQFALCVTLYEALYGERPFAGTSLIELETATRAGARVPTATGALWPAIRRGLSPDPAARFASLDALGAALRRARYRRRHLTIAGGVLAMVAASVAAYAIITHRDPIDVHAEAAWNPARAAAIADAAHRTSTSSAEYLTSSLTRLSARFDARIASWRDASRALRDAQPVDAAVDTARRDCIARAWTQLDTLASLAATGKPRILALVPVNLDELQAPSECLEARALPARPKGQRIAELERILDMLWLHATTGAADGAAPALALVRAEVEATGYAPLVIASLEIEAKLASERSDLPGRRAALERALAIAPDEGTRVRILWRLIDLVTHEAPDPAAARRWDTELETAFAHLVAIPTLERHYLEIEVNESHAQVARTTGDLHGAIERHTRAVELTRAYFGEHSRAHANALKGLGTDQQNAADYATAVKTLGRALEVLQAEVGADDPQVANLLVLLGNAKFGTWDVDGARKAYETALAIETAAYGERDPHRLAALGGLMLVSTTTNDYQLVLTYAVEQIEIARATRPDPEVLLGALMMAGVAHWQLTNVVQGRTELDEAIALGEKVYGADSARLVPPLLARAQLDISTGDYVHARADSERARAIGGMPMATATLGMLDLIDHAAESARARFHAVNAQLTNPADPQRIQTLAGEGRALLALGRSSEASRLLEQAAALAKQLGASGLDVSAIDLARSQLRWPRDRPGAIALARSAREQLEADRRGAFYLSLAPEVHGWCEHVGIAF